MSWSVRRDISKCIIVIYWNY